MRDPSPLSLWAYRLTMCGLVLLLAVVLVICIGAASGGVWQPPQPTENAP